MVTREQAAEMERKTRYQSKYLSWYEERWSNYIFLLGLSLQEAFQYIAGFTCEFYFESVYVPIDATVLCLGKGQRRQSPDVYKQEWHKRGHSSLEVTMSDLVISPE